jgi:hypothetical protein
MRVKHTRVKHPPAHKTELMWANPRPGVFSLSVRTLHRYNANSIEYYIDTLFGVVRSTLGGDAMVDASLGWVASRDTFDIHPRHFSDLGEAKLFLESLYALEKV